MEKDLSIKHLQTIVDQWIRTYGVRYFSELTNLAILVEETGELARLMARIYGDQSFKRNIPPQGIADELADILFVLVCIANQTGVDLSSAIQDNIKKKTTRDSKRHIMNAKLRRHSDSP